MKKYICPKCHVEVIDDFELMDAHLYECDVHCKSCKYYKTKCMDEPCRSCGGYQKWIKKSEVEK